MMHPTKLLAVSTLILLGACKDKAAIARADSLQAIAGERQALAEQLSSQKDSLTRVVVDADAFLGQMDSAIKTVKGMPRGRRAGSDPIAAQLQSRRDMQERVLALVARAKESASQLAGLEEKFAHVTGENLELRTKIEQDAQLIADLGATIERQHGQIAMLEARLDTLTTEVRALGTRHYKAYYVIGTEKELRDMGIAVREGGANLLFARPGRTLVPARELNPASFTAIDQRQLNEIQVPDTTRRYRVISRHNLDDADVDAREGTTFKGNLKISKPDEFWAPSRYLILVRL